MAIDTAPSEPSVTPRIELKIPIAVGPGDLAGPTPVSETLGSGRLEIAGLNAFYGSFRALREIGLSIRPNAVTAVIGPKRWRRTSIR